MINPDRVKLWEQPREGFVYRNTSFMGDVEAYNRVCSTTYIFAYRLPFFRPHSISLGAGGVVEVSLMPAKNHELAVMSDVTIIKSDDITSMRNFGFVCVFPLKSSTQEILTGQAEIDYEAMARLGVSNAVEEYRNQSIFDGLIPALLNRGS